MTDGPGIGGTGVAVALILFVVFLIWAGGLDDDD